MVRGVLAAHKSNGLPGHKGEDVAASSDSPHTSAAAGTPLPSMPPTDSVKLGPSWRVPGTGFRIPK
jgi:hypothetical protein